jgi:competence protein ComEA
MHRLALLTLCLLTLVPTLHRQLQRSDPAVTCAPAGKGAPPRHWLGCVEDPGPARELSGQERLMTGMPIDLGSATPEDLAGVPGLSPRLGIEIARDRAQRGPFRAVDDLIRVRGIGPSRLARARPFLSTAR